MSEGIAFSKKEGWIPCSSDEDWSILKMLYDVHFKEEPPNLEEKETLYREPPKGNATVKLLWQENEAVGFYFYRCKGVQSDGPFSLHMPVLDGAFIRKSWRRKGWGTIMIKDFISTFPEEDYLGFSEPISNSLWLVLKAFLTAQPSFRKKLWAVNFCGEEGDRMNIWISLASGKYKLMSK